jgi:hypothetical protein
MTADEIFEHLRELYPLPKWALLREVRFSTGFGRHAERRIDAFAINCYPSQGLWRVAIEIKVDRYDFLRELQEPAKRMPWVMISNEFYFATPPGLIDMDEAPAGQGFGEGIIEVNPVTGAVIRANAEPRPNPEPVPLGLFASIMRRADAAERKRR